MAGWEAGTYTVSAEATDITDAKITYGTETVNMVLPAEPKISPGLIIVIVIGIVSLAVAIAYLYGRKR